MADLPDVLRLTEMGAGRFEVTQPAESAEGRDVVFSGQFIAQMLMAAEAREERQKSPRSIHTLFSRVGSYTKPIELQVDVLHTGRTWGSDTITAYQDGRPLCRSLVLMTSQDPDLMRHQPNVPADLPGPGELVAEFSRTRWQSPQTERWTGNTRCEPGNPGFGPGLLASAETPPRNCAGAFPITVTTR